jgi:putative lipase involved disintegration of autophagic bodies
MPSSNPKFLMDMLHRVVDGKTVTGKSGNLIIEKSDNGRFLFVYHFGTLTLKVDFYKDNVTDKVVYQYGESQTDARYLNCILGYYNLSRYFDIGYGSVNGWRFTKILSDSGEILDKKERIEDWNYKGGEVNA